MDTIKTHVPDCANEEAGGCYDPRSAEIGYRGYHTEGCKKLVNAFKEPQCEKLNLVCWRKILCESACVCKKFKDDICVPNHVPILNNPCTGLLLLEDQEASLEKNISDSKHESFIQSQKEPEAPHQTKLTLRKRASSEADWALVQNLDSSAISKCGG